MAHLNITKDYLERQFQNFNDDFLSQTYLQQDNLYIKKLTTPTTDMLSSYQLIATDVAGVEHALGYTIDIPKDYLVKNAEVKICEVNNVPVEGYLVGDKYIDFTINSKDDSGTETHLYIAFKELIQLQAGEGIEITNNNEISVDFSKVTSIEYVNFTYVPALDINLIDHNSNQLITADGYYLVTQSSDESLTPDKTYEQIITLSHTNQKLVIGRIYDNNQQLISTCLFIGDTFITTALDDENNTQYISYKYLQEQGIWVKENFIDVILNKIEQFLDDNNYVTEDMIQ